MKFTIAIPVYNNKETIERAVKSGINQTFKGEYEVLVVDNVSTDGTTQIVEKLKSSKLFLVKNKKHIGLFQNHNECLKRARGKYVIFCHADDYLEPGALEVANKHLTEKGYPEKYVFWGRSVFKDYSRHLKNSNLELNTILEGDDAITPFLGGGLTPSGTCYSKDFYEHVGFVDSPHPLSPSDSTSMILAALKGFSFEMIDWRLFYREKESTNVSGLSISYRLDSLESAYSSLFEIIDETDIRRVLWLSSKSSITKYRKLNMAHVGAMYSFKLSLHMLLQILYKNPGAIKKKHFRTVVFRLLNRAFRGQQSHGKQ